MIGSELRRLFRLVVRPPPVEEEVDAEFGFHVDRWLESLLFQTSPRDPWVFSAVAVGLLLAALVGSLVPAVRAARVKPMDALRGE